MSVVATFKIDYLRILDEEGHLLETIPDFAREPKTLLNLYRYMILTRRFDAKAVALQRTGQMGTFPSSLGQEAFSVGMGHAIHKEDVFCPYYRDHGAMFLRGVKLSEVLAFWGGDERGSHYTRDKEDFPIAIPIGTQMLHAAGVAYAIKLRKQKRAVLTACGDGATSKSDFSQAINAAGTWHLPLVLVVNNNQWAISVPRDKQSAAKTLAQKAIAGGFRGLQVDGNDVIAVRHAVAEALDRARNGEGPSLIEAISYRLCDHTTADDASRYVNKEDLEEAWKHEPIVRLRNYLIQQDFITEQYDEEIQQECDHEVESAVEEYLDAVPQKPESMFDYLYYKLPKTLIEQRNEVMGV